jgi:ATP-dependent exoDNAse (exonuclease V) beta subunit
MRFTAEQQRCIEFAGLLRDNQTPSNLVIEAGAGAGKTAVLAQRVVWKVALAPAHERLEPHEIVLVTFTKAAERELSGRVADLLAEQAPLTTGAVHISTIDSLLMSLFDAYFPGFWFHTYRGLEAGGSDTKHPETTSQAPAKFRSPPRVKLIEEEQATAELESRFSRFFDQVRSSMEATHFGAICDFLLAGGLSTPWATATYSGQAFGRDGRDEVLRFLTSESCLLLSGPPLELLQQTIHPGAALLFERLIQFGRQCALMRLHRGQITHTDRLVFLHNLYCAAPAARSGTPYGGIEVGNLMTAREIIVDEYQDTNPAQHELLVAIAARQNARMIVVGDPKQSLYRFRQAKVEVFQTLTKQSEWQRIVLPDNFRSNPELLNELNALARIALSFQSNKSPPGFWDSDHGKAALSCRVEPLDLRAGRLVDESIAPVTTQAELRDPVEEQVPRLTILTHSLNSNRLNDELVNELAKSSIRYPDLSEELVINAVRRLETSGLKGPDIAVLCETNKDADRVTHILHGAGIHCARESKSKHQNQSDHALRAAITLIECVRIEASAKRPTFLSCLQLFDLFTSPLFGLTMETAAQLSNRFQQALERPEAHEPQSVLFNLPGILPDEWKLLVRLSRTNFFAAWLCLVHLLRSRAPLAKTLGPRESDFFQHSLFEWILRFSFAFEDPGLRAALQQNTSESIDLPALSILPSEILAKPLRQIASGGGEGGGSIPKNAGVSVLTVHAAKGLQWKGVVFLPKTSDRQQNPTFRCLPLGDRNVVEWLKEPGDLEMFARVTVTNARNPAATIGPDQLTTNSHRSRNASATALQDNDEFAGGSHSAAESAPESAEKRNPIDDLKFQEQAEAEFERARVFYTAITRAEERLVLLSGLGMSNRKKSIRDDFEGIVAEDSDDKFNKKFESLIPWTLARYLDSIFDLRFRRPAGKRSKAIPAEPWTTQECAQRHTAADSPPRPVEYFDYSAPSLHDRIDAYLRRKENKQTNEVSDAAKDSESNIITVENAAAEKPLWPSVDEDLTSMIAEVWREAELPAAYAPSEASSPSRKNEPDDGNSTQHHADQAITSRIDKIQQGILFHAEQELQTESNERSELAQLERASVVVLREFEIWTLDTALPPSRGPLLPSPRRHILDLLCSCELSRLPGLFAAAPLFRVKQVEGKLIMEQCPTGSEFHSLTPRPSVEVVIDYKTGSPDPDHKLQMLRYLDAVAQLRASHVDSISQPHEFELLLIGCIAYISTARDRGPLEHRTHQQLVFLDSLNLT